MIISAEFDDNIPDLNIEFINDGKGEGLIHLQQGFDDELGRLTLHPVQLRFLAEKVGLVPASEPAAAKAIATLERRLRVLRDRIEALGGLINDQAGSTKPEVWGILAHVTATADIAQEFCADMGDVPPVVERERGTDQPPANGDLFANGADDASRV